MFLLTWPIDLARQESYRSGSVFIYLFLGWGRRRRCP
jgi:hypothetical protein